MFTRRNILSSMGLGAGAGLLGPMVTRMIPEALGQSVATKRIIFYFEQVVSTTDGQRPVPNGADFTLNAFSRLDKYKKDLLLVGNFYNPHGIDQHGNARSTLNVVASAPADAPKFSQVGGITIDRLIAKQAGAGDPVSSLSLSLFGRSDPEESQFSADGPGQPYPQLNGPVAAFSSTFAKLATPSPMGSTGPNLEQLKTRSVLDFVNDDVKRLNTRLAAPERRKLDQYLTSLSALQTKVQRLGMISAGCHKPAVDPKLGLDTMGRPGRLPSTREEALASLDIVANTVGCGLSRVVNIADTAGAEPPAYAGLPEITSVHQMGHGLGQPTSGLKWTDFQADMLEQLRMRLEAIPEGNGTVADNTMIVFAHHTGGSHHGGHYSWWFLIWGGAGVFKTGRFLKLPETAFGGRSDPRSALTASNGKPLDAEHYPNVKSCSDHCISDFFVSLANAMGAPIKTFGDPKFCQGPLPGLTG